MTRTQFRNASGLPNPEQYSTARDMMVLGAALQDANFPRYFAYFKTDAFTFRGRTYRNHNKLLGRVEGVDGIKTGYTRGVRLQPRTSVQRAGRTFVAVVMGGLIAGGADRQMESLIAAHVPGAAGAAVASASTPKRSDRVADAGAGPSQPGPNRKRAAAASAKTREAAGPAGRREASASETDP